jgi:hypothetical protein
MSSGSSQYRDALRKEFEAAVAELLERQLTNPNLGRGWYSQIGNSVFDSCCLALEDSRDPHAHKSFPGTPHSKQARMHVISAPIGSGKTSFSVTFVAAMVRLAERNPGVPYGCLFVAEQIARADQIYRDLSVLIPGRVAIWTTDHDASPKSKVPTKVLNPAAKFTKEQLRDFPVAIVTHAFFTGKWSDKARYVSKQGYMQRRALTVIDERVEGVTVYDVDLATAAEVRQRIKEDANLAEEIGEPIDALVEFMSKREFAEGMGSLEKRTSDLETWREAERSLSWFTTPQAALHAKAHSNDDGFKAVFGFAKALALGYAFINRQHGVHFVGYETNLVIDPGTVLLDATSDIDGISQLCPWRQHQEVPHARYDNLKIVQVPAHTNKNLAVYLKSAKNRHTYVDWLVALIKEQVAPGQKALVVVKKSLIDNENVPTWPARDKRFETKKLYTEQWGWEIEGRSLCVVHWGTGVGDNTWKDADCVLLCDDFYLPRRTVIATAQGLRNHKATEGALGSMRSHNSKEPAVDVLQEGHILRWSKQMALRGKGREYDEHGICGHQKLIWTGSTKKCLANVAVLFPGAHIKVVQASDIKQTQAEAFLEIMRRTKLPSRLTHEEISALLKRPWRELSKHLMRNSYVLRELERLGWTYRPGRGRAGSFFERIERSAADGSLPLGYQDQGPDWSDTCEVRPS